MQLTGGADFDSSSGYMSSSPSIAQLKRALTISEQIQKLEAELAALFGASAKAPASAKTAAATAQPRRKKRGLSAAGRARIAAAQKARWAKARNGAPKAAGQPKARRTLSPEARARIVAAVKRRWAEAKRAK